MENYVLIKNDDTQCPGEYTTIEEISKESNISQRMIRRYVASGALPSTQINNKFAILVEDWKKFSETLNDNSTLNNNENPLSSYRQDDSHQPHLESIREFWDVTPDSDMTFVDCFCGAGGLTKGLELSGMHGICGLDFFLEAGLTYKRNFVHPFVYGDITKEETKQLFYETVNRELNGRELDVVAGGFPCQGFSMSGNRIVDDSRNTLYKELIEIVKTLKPKFVICENVKGLRTMLDGRVEQKILSDFEDIGYKMNVTVLNAANYYVPQKRERVIFIGNRIGVENYHPGALLQENEYVTVGEAIGDLMDIEPDKQFNHEPCVHNKDMQERIMKVKEGESLYPNYKESYKKCPWNQPSCTIKENHGGTNLHPRLPRVITAREMARLQSFPDDFIFEGKKSKQLTQIGNAVPPLLAKAIGLAVRLSAGDLNKSAATLSENKLENI